MHGIYARVVARALLDTECVKISIESPFTLTSGTTSSIYIDVRRLLSFPDQRDMVIASLAAEISQIAGDAQVIAGGETAGIPYAALVAEKLGKPMVYVRKKPKDFGTTSQIEGVVNHGQSVLLVEDLASEGTSKANFVNAIRRAGGRIDHCFVVVERPFPSLKETMNNLHVTLHALTTLDDILDVAKEYGHHL